MRFKKAGILMVVVWMGVIFIMSHLNGMKSWYITGELWTVSKTGTVITELNYEEKMEKYETQGVKSQMIFLRKMAHFFEYFVLAILLMNALIFRMSWFKSTVWTITIGTMYAIFDEVHQLFVPGRSGNIVDIFIDFSGLIFSLIVLWLIKKIKEKLFELTLQTDAFKK